VESTIRGWFERVAYYFPLSILGAPLLVALFWLLGKGFATANPYAYLISVGGLALLILLAILSRIQAARIDENQIAWNTKHRVFAAKEPAPHSLDLHDGRLLPFFRVRYTLEGDLRTGNTFLGYYRRSGRFIPGRSERIDLPLSLPHCGRFQARLRLNVEDIFGLSRARCGVNQTRQIPVQPGVIGKAVDYRIAERGAEEKNRMQESEVERYYMREYIPGDRFRDINWKASGRGDKLFTRISPIAQEETTTVTIYARFHAEKRRLSPGLLALAEHQKSWIISFILKIREEHPDYLFQVYLNNSSRLVESEDDLELLAAELGDFWFSSQPAELPELPPEGELYLFATPADRGVDAVRSAYPKLDLLLYLSRLGVKEDKEKALDWPLYPSYQGEDFPAPALLFDRERQKEIFSRRLPGITREGVLIPRLIRRQI